MEEYPQSQGLTQSQSQLTNDNQKNWLKISLLILGGLILLVGAFYAGIRFSENKEKQSATNLPTTKIESPTLQAGLKKIKIGGYEIESKVNYEVNTSWEEVKYIKTLEAQSEKDILPVLTELYPDYVNRADSYGKLYIERIEIRDGIANIFFGGDEKLLTDRSGSTGAALYAGILTLALTEDPRIQKVDFKLARQGTHSGPGVNSRNDTKYLWPSSMLEEAANSGDTQAREILNSRSTAK